MVVQMINVGEQTGALDQMLAKIADFYEEEVDTAVQGFREVDRAAPNNVLGGVIGTIVTAMHADVHDHQVLLSPPPARGAGTDRQAMAVETKKLRWLVAIRLVVITSVAVVHILRALSPERGLSYEPFLYAITGATYALCLVYLVLPRWLRGRAGGPRRGPVGGRPLHRHRPGLSLRRPPALPRPFTWW